MDNTRELLLQTSRFSVERLRRAMPDGTCTTREIVAHPGAVVILPILEDGTLVMIRNFRPAVGRELLELPAGTLEKEETPADCARHELEEETGYRANEFQPLPPFYTSPGISTERMYGFVARDLTRTAQKLDPGEQIRVEIMQPDKILQLLRQGVLEDAKSIAVLARHFLQQG